MAKKTELDDMKDKADALDVEYGGNIGLETLTERVEDAEEANGKMSDEQIAEQEAEAVAATEALEAEALAELTAEAEARAEAEAEVEAEAEAAEEEAEAEAEVVDADEPAAEDEAKPRELTGAEALALNGDY
jgi:uncharacterized membrane protein YqiK